MHGFLLVDKPAGWTSHDVVAKLRGVLRERRVGHGGTLDPFATGLLVVGVGRATRLLQYAQSGSKRYLAHVVLGAQTSTDDIDGEMVNQPPTGRLPDRSLVDQALEHFTGWIEQRPPAYSAVRVGGERMYARRRRGEEVEAPHRSVYVKSMEVVDYHPPDLVLEIECGSGTYIRSIARDLGTSLGTGAYCHGLRRTAAGNLRVADATSINDLAEGSPRDHWTSLAIHPDAVVADLPALALNQEQTVAWYHGRQLAIGDDLAAQAVRVYGFGGEFAGVADLEAGVAKPSLVLSLD